MKRHQAVFLFDIKGEAMNVICYQSGLLNKMCYYLRTELLINRSTQLKARRFRLAKNGSVKERKQSRA